MVENSSNSQHQSMNKLIINFFKANLPSFSLENETVYGPFWGATFFNENGIEVRIRGENDGFDIVIKIDKDLYPLWKFDRSVNNKTEATNENILYQLTVLKNFLD